MLYDRSWSLLCCTDTSGKDSVNWRLHNIPIILLCCFSLRFPPLVLLRGRNTRVHEVRGEHFTGGPSLTIKYIWFHKRSRNIKRSSLLKLSGLFWTPIPLGTIISCFFGWKCIILNATSEMKPNTVCVWQTMILFFISDINMHGDPHHFFCICLIISSTG